MDQPSRSLADYLSTLPDPRIERAKRHRLIDILVIAICASICDADGWEEIETFGQVRLKWFKSFLALPGGIPSHDTFARVFARLDPKAFQKCFLGWIKSVADVTGDKIVALDGKKLRRSFDKSKGVGPLHLVSAWSRENQLTLGQVKVEEGENEIPAIHSLLELLELKGCIVTIDAIGCQREIANKIVTQGGDYVLALKGNQPGVHGDVSLAFDGAEVEQLTMRLGQPVTVTDGDHGRIEERRYWLTSDIDWLAEKGRWAGLKGLGIAERRSEEGGRLTVERRYFLVSFAGDVERFAKAVRGHWSIETSLHWRLDVTFREDQSRIRKGHAAENFAMLRRAALSLLANAPSKKKKESVARKRWRASLDEKYLEEILQGTTTQVPEPAP